MRAPWLLPAVLALGCATGLDDGARDAACLGAACDERPVAHDAPDFDRDAFSRDDDASAVEDDAPPLPDAAPDAALPDASEAPPDAAGPDRPPPPDAAPSPDAAPDRAPLPDAAPDACAGAGPTASGHAERGRGAIEEIRAEGAYLEVRSDDRRDRITFTGVTVSGRVRDVTIRSVRASGSQLTLGGQTLTFTGATVSGAVDFGAAELASIDGSGATLRFTDTRGVSGVITLRGAVGCP